MIKQLGHHAYWASPFMPTLIGPPEPVEGVCVGASGAATARTMPRVFALLAYAFGVWGLVKQGFAARIWTAR